ncbi:MAG TPA: Stp1/IreP family PP2C-type Ser/Thr phosphatase [Ktedonobacterales bacterium]
MAKKLRIMVAHQTDVGRKRERNQDNVAHFIPADEATLDRLGAFFVVCDGMGGHAAGEVASELGVNTLRDAYFANKGPDVISALASAVDQANATIYDHGKEHPELNGMGTTCVSLVLEDGRAFVVNIGDSRAYIARDGEMRQVTQDHSWVAEQVRYGLLTEEQARGHTHRNVITRSLGTQPAVTADLFIETLHDGDRVLLCSDGLHGYVEEADMARQLMADQTPDQTVRTLVDMANEAGGPDNVTALVVHVLEVPEPQAQLHLPGTDEPAEEGVTQPLPVVTAEPATAKGKSRTAPVSRTRKRNRSVILIRRTVELVALVAIVVGAWYVIYGPIAQKRSATSRLQSDVASAQVAITQSGSQDPAAALASLARQRTKLLSDAADTNADPSAISSVRDLLNGDLAVAIKTTTQRYQQAAKFSTLDNTTFSTWDASASCIAPGASAAAPLVSVTSLATLPASLPPAQPHQPAPTAGSLPTFAVNSGVLFWLGIPTDAQLNPVGGAVTCVAIPMANVQAVLGITAQGSTLLALVQGSDSSYSVQAVTFQTPATGGATTVQVQQHFAVPTPAAEKPVTITSDSGAVYIGYASGSSGSPGMWTFSGDTTKGPAATTKLTHDPVALAAATGGVFSLLADGSISFTTGSSSQSVVAQAPLPISPLNEADNYVIATPVPAPVVPSPQGTLFGAGTSLAVSPASGTTLIVSDVVNNRFIRYTTSGASLTLGGQYLPATPIGDSKRLTLIAPNGKSLALIWSAGKLIGVPVPLS